MPICAGAPGGRRPPGAGMAAQVEAAAIDLGLPVDGGHVAR
ncbi:hypothetical protein [Streptomyces koelreuteriae]